MQNEVSSSQSCILLLISDAAECVEPYSGLFIDLHQQQRDILRIRSSIVGDVIKCFYYSECGSSMGTNYKCFVLVNEQVYKRLLQKVESIAVSSNNSNAQRITVNNAIPSTILPSTRETEQLPSVPQVDGGTYQNSSLQLPSSTENNKSVEVSDSTTPQPGGEDTSRSESFDGVQTSHGSIATQTAEAVEDMLVDTPVSVSSSSQTKPAPRKINRKSQAKPKVSSASTQTNIKRFSSASSQTNPPQPPPQPPPPKYTQHPPKPPPHTPRPPPSPPPPPPPQSSQLHPQQTPNQLPPWGGERDAPGKARKKKTSKKTKKVTIKLPDPGLVQPPNPQKPPHSVTIPENDQHMTDDEKTGGVVDFLPKQKPKIKSIIKKTPTQSKPPQLRKSVSLPAKKVSLPKLSSTKGLKRKSGMRASVFQERLPKRHKDRKHRINIAQPDEINKYVIWE